LFAQLRTQLVSAAYLWRDTENRSALYSAAGHPPLLHCREGKLERIESNGLLLGAAGWSGKACGLAGSIRTHLSYVMSQRAGLIFRSNPARALPETH